MVYYYTSQNVKMIRNLLLDFKTVNFITAYEYIQNYIEKCPESIEDAKLAWITETFLGIQKHEDFLKEIAGNVCEVFTEDEQDYFLIIFFGLIFQVQPKDMGLIYKCLYNLSKTLLTSLTKFLSNNEVLNYIAQVGSSNYDANYLTDKIIGPLYMWQPYIGEMGNTYAEYLRKIEQRKQKRPTIPIHPKVLSHKPKPSVPPAEPSSWSLPAPPPNSTVMPPKNKSFSKSAMDRKLLREHEKNKQKAADLLFCAKNNTAHYTQDKSEKYKKHIANFREQIDNTEKPMRSIMKKKISSTVPEVSVKDTAANLKRINRRIQNEEKNELEWFENLMRNFSNDMKFNEFEEKERQEQERERLFDIEKKHLLAQLSFEEAVIAKKKLQEQNKRKGEEVLKEKELWYQEIENWKKKEMEQQRKQVEKLSLAELSLSEAKTNMTLKKKENVEKFKKQLEELREKALKARNEELERRIQMIKEIRLLSLVARKAKVPKMLDMTETAGLGLLCEMSMAELQERLNTLKISIQEELEAKRKSVREEKLAAQKDLEETKQNIQTYLADKAKQRLKDSNKNLKTKVFSSAEDLETPSLKEINKLQKMLEEKRSLRKRMCQ